MAHIRNVLGGSNYLRFNYFSSYYGQEETYNIKRGISLLYFKLKIINKTFYVSTPKASN